MCEARDIRAGGYRPGIRARRGQRGPSVGRRRAAGRAGPPRAARGDLAAGRGTSGVGPLRAGTNAGRAGRIPQRARGPGQPWGRSGLRYAPLPQLHAAGALRLPNISPARGDNGGAHIFAQKLTFAKQIRAYMANASFRKSMLLRNPRPLGWPGPREHFDTWAGRLQFVRRPGAQVRFSPLLCACLARFSLCKRGITPLFCLKMAIRGEFFRFFCTCYSYNLPRYYDTVV